MGWDGMGVCQFARLDGWWCGWSVCVCLLHDLREHNHQDGGYVLASSLVAESNQVSCARVVKQESVSQSASQTASQPTKALAVLSPCYG